MYIHQNDFYLQSYCISTTYLKLQDTTPDSRLYPPNYQVPKVEERLSMAQESNSSNTSWWDVGKYVAIGFAAAVPLAFAVSGYNNEKTKKENDKDERK